MKALLKGARKTLAEPELKYRTPLMVLLALLAGVLSVALSMTPMVQAGGGSVGGVVLWIDQYGNAHNMAWAQVTADDGVSAPVVTYTTDGTYMMWLPAGTYDITAASDPGFFPDTATGVVVSPGSSTSIDFTLEPTGQPIPEVPPWSQALVAVCAVTVTIVAARRHRTRTRA